MNEKHWNTNDLIRFAETAFENHKGELSTRYRDREIDASTLEEAYRQHAVILENELKEKIHLMRDGAASHKELDEVKNRYVSRLRQEGKQQS